MAVNSLTHLAEVMATRNATFIKRWEREHVANSSKGGFMRAERKGLRSHAGVRFSTGGKVLSKPFTKQAIVRCINTEVPST